MNVLDAHEPYAAPKPYDRLFPGRMEGVGDVNRAYLKTGLLPPRPRCSRTACRNTTASCATWTRN